MHSCTPSTCLWDTIVSWHNDAMALLDGCADVRWREKTRLDYILRGKVQVVQYASAYVESELDEVGKQ